MDSGNPSPDNTFTSERVSRSPPGPGSESDSRSLDMDSLSVDEGVDQVGGATVIQVESPPLDSSVQSAEVSPGPALVHEGLSRGSIDRTVRCGAPRRLSPQLRLRVSSQDSLASTGSNQELRDELESSLAVVKAAVEDVVRLTSPDSEVAPEIGQRTPEEETVMELATRPAGSREGIGRKLSMEEVEVRRKSQETGARPRSVQTPTVTPRSGRSVVELEGVLLKQNSWGSRKVLKEPEVEVEQISAFVRKKELWERRTHSSPSSDDERGEKVGFRGNRDFWEQRSLTRVNTPGQTPDLVMDLPAGALASSPPVPAPRPRKSRSPSSDSVSSRSTASSEDSTSSPPPLSSADTFAADTDTLRKTSSSAAAGHPTPKRRPEPLLLSSQQRSTVVPIRSPGPRTPKLTPKFPSSSTETPLSGTGATSSFKPSVRVKPLLQVKPTEIKKDSSPKDFKSNE